MKVAVLVYHSQNVNGRDYGNNDHVALARDLATIAARGIPVVRLGDAVSWWLSARFDRFPAFSVALTCDDGTSLDWDDFDHPAHGPQRSFRSIIADHARDLNIEAKGYMTSFVIGSPSARREIDDGCYAGYRLSDDRWWKPAQAEGIIDIENHSWDHLHPCVSVVAHSEQQKGDFSAARSFDDADAQVRQSADYIDGILSEVGHRTTLFAYPYGHASRYLSRDYLPNYRHLHRVRAAFVDDAEYWTAHSDRYEISRFVCGKAWRDEQAFAELLRPE